MVTLQNWEAEGESAFHSANDRSRWATVRALGDHGTYEIDEVSESGQAIKWSTIDMVRHVGSDGYMHSYSSKPTLYPTMVTGVYKAIKMTTGMTITDQSLWVPRIILMFTNVLPWGVFLFFLATMSSARKPMHNSCTPSNKAPSEYNKMGRLWTGSQSPNIVIRRTQ